MHTFGLVVESLKTLGRLFPCDHPAHVVIVSVDGSPAVLNQIRNGYVDAVATQDLYGMGAIAMSNALRLAMDKPIAKSTVRIPPVTVTRANVDTASVWGNSIYRIFRDRSSPVINSKQCLKSSLTGVRDGL